MYLNVPINERLNKIPKMSDKFPNFLIFNMKLPKL